MWAIVGLGNPGRKYSRTRHNIGFMIIEEIAGRYDIEIRKLRIRRKGSSGGHKGIESVIQSISSKDFVRLKIGIGRDKDVAPEDYVLSRFRRDEISLMKKAIEKASEAATLILAEGIEKAMNIFNTN